MAKIYVVASGKGGTGKTTTVINLGAALNKFKEDVVLMDVNLTTPNLGLYFGAPIVPVSLNHVLQNKAPVEEAIYEHESGIKLIPSSLSLDNLKKIDTEKILDVTKKLKRISSHIILDSSAGLGEEARAAIKLADEVLIVTNPNILSVTDSLKTIKLAEEFGKKIRGVIVTRVKNCKTEMSLDSIQEMLESDILGVVPEDEAIEESLVKKNAVINIKPRSKASKAYVDIAAKLLGKQKKSSSLLERFLKSLGLI